MLRIHHIFSQHKTYGELSYNLKALEASNKKSPGQTKKTGFNKKLRPFVVMSDKSVWMAAGKEAVKAQRHKGNLSFALLMPENTRSLFVLMPPMCTAVFFVHMHCVRNGTIFQLIPPCAFAQVIWPRFRSSSKRWRRPTTTWRQRGPRRHDKIGPSL